MSYYQLIITITIPTKVKVSFEEELLIVIFKYHIKLKIWRIACKMAVKFLSKHQTTN